MPTPHLLVIDDDDCVRRTLARMLRRDFTVSCASDVESALARIDAGDVYDVILCDRNLPRLSGQDFYERLMARPCGLAARVVIITGQEPEHDDEFATMLGDRYLMKLTPRAELLSTLFRIAFPRLSAPDAAA
jgi:CheY-like chemotaxis protein